MLLCSVVVLRKRRRGMLMLKVEVPQGEDYVAGRVLQKYAES